MVSVLLVPAGVVTCTVADDSVTSNGTCALICPGATKKSGALVPLNVTLTPCNVRWQRIAGRHGQLGNEVAAERSKRSLLARREPQLSKDAPFTIPLAASTRRRGSGRHGGRNRNARQPVRQPVGERHLAVVVQKSARNWGLVISETTDPNSGSPVRDHFIGDLVRTRKYALNEGRDAELRPIRHLALAVQTYVVGVPSETTCVPKSTAPLLGRCWPQIHL